MLIFKDVITGDEVLSDAFPKLVIDDVIWEVQTKNIVKTGDDSGIPNNDEDGGDIPSDAVTVNNVIDAHGLVETKFVKKDYLTYLKGYLKSVEAHLAKANPGRVDAFKKAAQTFVTKKLLPKFDEFQFFTGSSMDPTGIVVLMWYPDGEVDPKIWVFFDGLKEQKV
eukprot:TRINITY_DN1104_c0_g1_i2.p1 TRINITY_DN1104_c0_g1~~TRINITY_DN1104_c0_g1_i2.p1  ORF type:complete len:166 (-),score=41.01 TRINITY_DN1104_c0_g1_i2:41-538(-)